MNTRPPSQHETLNDEERELARVVRALPGGEPPSALDALILKAASDAVASSPHPHKKSLWSNGILGTSVLWLGTAAASVLTVGIGWQVFQSMRAPIYELPADQNVSSAQQIEQVHEDAPLIVEMTPARAPLPTSPPPPEAMTDSELTADAAASIASAEKPKASAPEKPKHESEARQEMMGQALAKKTDDDRDNMERYQAAEMAASPQVSVTAAPPPPPATTGASARDSERKELNTITVTGSRVRRADQISNAKITPREAIEESVTSKDAKLSPELWLYEIRDRIKRDDIAGAKASLRLYRQTYPKLAVPEDLQPLLK